MFPNTQPVFKISLARADVFRACLATVLLLGAAAPPRAAAAEPARWAVIASAALDNAGLADLVTVKLSSEAGIALVERQQIAAAAAEMSLEKSLGGGDVNNRQQLGRTLGADAMVLLSVAQAGERKQEALNVVVADTRSGARLRVEAIPYDPAKLEQLAERVAAVVRETRGRFAGGVKSVVGVPPFVSKDLTRDADHLQSGFARLVESGLSTVPGVAVVEIDEARTLQRELALAGNGDGVARVVPLLLEGDFSTTRGRGDAASDAERRVRLSIRPVTKDAAREPIVREDLSLADAAKFLSGELAGLLLKDQPADAAAAAGLAPEQQFAALAARGETFAALGSWAHSIPVREAALLINPAAAELRVAIVHDTYRLIEPESEAFMRRRGVLGYRQKYLPDDATRADILRWRGEREPMVLRGLEHVEHLARTGRSNVYEAVELSRHLVGCYGKIVYHVPEPEGPEFHRSARATIRDFAFRVFPAIYKLEPGPKRSDSIYNPCSLWEGMLFQFVIEPFGPMKPYAYGKDDFDAALRATSLVPAIDNYPDGMRVGTRLLPFVCRWAGGEGYSGPMDRDRAAFRDFLRELERSDKPAFVQTARWGRLWDEWRASGLKQPTQKHVAALRALETEWRKLFTNDWERGATAFEPRRFSEKLGLRDDDPDRVPDEVRYAANDEVYTRQGLPPPPGRVRYVPLAVQFVKPSGERMPLKEAKWDTPREAPLLGVTLTACGDGLDVVCSSQSVMYQRRPGVFEEVLAEPGVFYRGATWDGRDVWVATYASGIRVLSAANDRPAVVVDTKSAGLPPHEKALMLHAIAPGKVLAVGSFGQPLRAWCAVVELDGERRNATVKIIHEATRTLNANEIPPSSKRDDPAVLAAAMETAWPFTPGYVSPATPDGSVVQISRQPDLRVADRHYAYIDHLSRAIAFRPLRIDLNTLKVTAFTSDVSYELGERTFLPSGESLTPYGVHLAAPGKSFPDGTRARRVVDSPTRLWWVMAEQVVPHEKWFYYPGELWFRIDPATWNVEALGGGLPPNDWSLGGPGHSLRYAASAHLGLVGWKGLHFFRIEILPPEAEGPEPIPKQPRPTRGGLAWDVRRQGETGVVTCGDVQLSINRERGGRAVILHVQDPLPKTYPDARTLAGVWELVRQRAKYNVSDDVTKRLREEADVNSNRWMRVPEQQERFLKLWDAMINAEDGPARDAAREALRAAIVDAAATYRRFIEEQPARIRAMLTPEQATALDRFGRGILIEPGEPR